MKAILSTVASIQDFLEKTLDFRKSAWVFRGEASEKYQPKPKVGRNECFLKNEQRIIDEFEREACGYIASRPDSKLEWLAIAQHHGLPTRLLDWTENPLVAAYFAVNNYQNSENGTIYALKIDQVIKDFEIDPFKINIITRYRPRHITERIRAQRGLFTIHPSPSQPLHQGSSEYKLEKITIDKLFKRKLHHILSRYAINQQTLFPELDGLSAHIQWKYLTDDPLD